MTDRHKQGLLTLVHGILASHPQGLKEHKLLAILRQRGLPVFSAKGHDPLALFRSHFLLFHLLYTLRDRLRLDNEADIEIHCLEIRLRPYQGIETMLPGFPDHLRAYYLDLNHLEEADRRSVEEMLSGFWKRFQAYDARPRYLAALGLNDPVSEAEVKRRYRELALIHHPDRGGETERFRQIVHAAEGLLGTP